MGTLHIATKMQLAKSLSGSVWRLILSISEACSPNRSQDSSGSLFSAILGLAFQIALRMPLEAHFEQFWSLLAKVLG
jgi:hypothetical protein